MTELEMAYWSGAAERAIELADELTVLGTTSPANLALPLLTGAWADLELGHEIRAVPTIGFRTIEGLPLEVEGIRHLAGADVPGRRDVLRCRGGTLDGLHRAARPRVPLGRG